MLLRLILSSLCALALPAAELTVGPGKQFADLATAVAKAQAGDTILVHETGKGDGAHRAVGVMVRVPKLTIRAVPPTERRGRRRWPITRVTLDGTGFDHSGRGAVPRAIVQFDPQAHGCVLEGFVLRGARNESHNGAGVRVNQANDVTVRDCEITDCQMGLMANGDVAQGTCDGLLVEDCHVHHNGEPKHAGYNHNFYLGGTRVTLRGCDVHHPTTGHNVKSRAHLTIVEGSFVHDSANREFDLVDAKGTTDVPGSHALIRGCLIVKAPGMQGNKAVIHFGQDGGNDHTGTLLVSHCTIVTPYISPVIDLSAPGAKTAIDGCIVTNEGVEVRNQVLLQARNGARTELACGSLALSPAFRTEATRALLAQAAGPLVYREGAMLVLGHATPSDEFQQPQLLDLVAEEPVMVPWKEFGYEEQPPLLEYVAGNHHRVREKRGARWDLGCKEGGGRQ